MKRGSRIIMAVAGALGAVGIIAAMLDMLKHFSIFAADARLFYKLMPVYAAAFLAGGISAYMLAPLAYGLVRGFIARLTELAGSKPLPELMLGLAGATLGIIAAFCISELIARMDMGLLGAVINAIIYSVLTAAGYAITCGRWQELPLPAAFSATHAAHSAAGSNVPKVLDTSVLVDGRIFDICRTGFMEGPLILPRFVIAELQQIADSADALRRNRGRRGLDIVTRIQKELDIELRIDETDFPDTQEVDIKLLKLTKLLHGSVMTNDYNLNKVAEVSGVSVLNINELAGALKPVLLPGEELDVQIVREGRENGQGVAFMEDGTMIVIENGRRFIGRTVTISVNTVLQTAAGRMIFARIPDRAAG